MPYIIGITGKKRSGKSTLANWLAEYYDYVPVGFADALKKFTLAMNPLVRNGELQLRLKDLVEWIGWERAKDEVPEVRRYLQEYGMYARGIDPDYWTNLAGLAIRPLFVEEYSVVIPDVRFQNEADYIERIAREHDADFMLIRMKRPRAGEDDPHPSETEQDAIVPDITIVNHGDDRLFKRAQAFLEPLGFLE